MHRFPNCIFICFSIYLFKDLGIWPAVSHSPDIANGHGTVQHVPWPYLFPENWQLDPEPRLGLDSNSLQRF